ncbi:MAG: M48 family metallopeptidase [Pseudomonadota bacterium]
MDIQLQDPPCRVRLVVNARARRFTLRLDPAGDGAILTHPPRVPRRDCESFLSRHSDWLRRALEKAGPVIAVAPGVQIPIDGRMRTVSHQSGRRAPELADDEITLYGRGAIGPKLTAFLKNRARDRLAPAAKAYAEQLGRKVSRVSLRDTRSRWGSCSSTGALSFSWRLAMAPVEVQDYVAAHEAAHLVEMNHSDRYWAVVERIMPDWKPHRAWLRTEGRKLHSYRFEAKD